MILTEQDKLAAYKAAVLEKVAAMSDEECATFVANAEAEKVAAQVSGDAQAGGRITYHGYKEAMERYADLLVEHDGDKTAAFNVILPEIQALDTVFADDAEQPKVAADAFSEADAEAQIKIASDESLPLEIRQLAHDTLGRHGYQLVDAA